MRNILVTGGLGFIGTHLIKKLLEQKNFKISVIDIKSGEDVKTIFKLTEDKDNSDLTNVANYKTNDNKISFFTQDIRDKERVLEIFKEGRFDTCIHLAAKVSVVDSIVNPEETFSVNEYGTSNILEACFKSRVGNFVFASSAATYGEPKILPIKEDHIIEPLSPYGASKVSGEALLCSYVYSGKISRGVSLRFFNVYGEGQNPEYAGVITKFAEKLSQGVQPVIFGDGQQTRDFIYVGDIVRAIILAAQSTHLSTGYHTFNIATGKSTSINNLASTMIKIFGLDLKPIFEKERIGEIRDGSSNISKAKKFLGFEVNVSLESGLTTFKNYFEKNSILRVN